MRLIALIFPCVYFLFTFRIIRAIISLILMSTLIGWPIASIWANSTITDARIRSEMKGVRKSLAA